MDHPITVDVVNIGLVSREGPNKRKSAVILLPAMYFLARSDVNMVGLDIVANLNNAAFQLNTLSGTVK